MDSELGPFEALTEDSAHERARMAHEVLGLALAGRIELSAGVDAAALLLALAVEERDGAK